MCSKGTSLITRKTRRGPPFELTHRPGIRGSIRGGGTTPRLTQRAARSDHRRERHRRQDDELASKLQQVVPPAVRQPVFPADAQEEVRRREVVLRRPGPQGHHAVRRARVGAQPVEHDVTAVRRGRRRRNVRSGVARQRGGQDRGNEHCADAVRHAAVHAEQQVEVGKQAQTRQSRGATARAAAKKAQLERAGPPAPARRDGRYGDHEAASRDAAERVPYRGRHRYRF